MPIQVDISRTTRLEVSLGDKLSHELRTPLTAIYFFVTNVLDGLLGDLTSPQHEHLALALSNIKQLKDMVSDLLDLTRAETHQLKIQPLHVSPTTLIADALSTCSTNAAAKAIVLCSEFAAGLPFLWADLVRHGRGQLAILPRFPRPEYERSRRRPARNGNTEIPRLVRNQVK